MTTTRATISKGYRVRLLLIALGLLIWGALCIKDGFFTYPEQSRVYAELQAFKEKPDWQADWPAHARENGYPTSLEEISALDPRHERTQRIRLAVDDFKAKPDWQTQWPEYAAERGYPTNINKVKERYEKDSLTQHLMAAGCIPIGLWFLWGWHRAGGRWVEADEQGLRNSKGQSAAWDAVTGVSADRWKSKGIAHVLYQDAQGQPQRMLLDDWKFLRDETQAIYQQVMAHLSPEQAAADEDAEASEADEPRDGEPVQA